MANIQRKGGLTPLEYLDGNAWEGKSRQYCVLSTDTNAYAIGDPVTLTGTSDAFGVAVVTLATAGSSNVLLGPMVAMAGRYYGGAQVIPGQLDTVIVPATKTANYYILVCDDPNVMYEIEEGGSGAALTASLTSVAGTCPVGLNYNLLSGTNTGYASGWTLDNTSGATSSTRQLQILGLIQRADVGTGAYAKWKVRINQHQWNGPSAGV
jgi:hypothetical protein